MEVIMTDPRDPYRDPRLDEPRLDSRFDEPGMDTRIPSGHAEGSWNATWGWVAGILAAIFIVAIVYGFANNRSTTASNTGSPPAATTGAAPSIPAPPATTGQGAR